MSSGVITNQEIEALLRELDRGPTERVAVGQEGIRPLTPQQPLQADELELPRGVWGSTVTAEDLLARSAALLRTAQRRIAELETRVTELEASRISSAPQGEREGHAIADAGRPVPRAREAWL